MPAKPRLTGCECKDGVAGNTSVKNYVKLYHPQQGKKGLWRGGMDWQQASGYYRQVPPSPLISGSLFPLSVQNRRKLQDCQYCHCTASKTSLYCGSEYKDGARPHLGLSFPGLLFNFHAVVFNFNTLQTWGGIQFGKSGELFNFKGKFKRPRKIKCHFTQIKSCHRKIEQCPRKLNSAQENLKAPH